MLPLDAIAYTNRWRPRHPGEKALLSLGLLVCAVVLPAWPGALVVGTVAAVILFGPAGLSLGQAAHALRVPLGFVTLGSVPLLFAVGGSAGVRIDPAGLPLAAQLAGRATAALLCLLLFAATTPLADVLPRLAHLGVPPAVTEIAALMYRMLFLLLDTIRAVREAQASRLGFRNCLPPTAHWPGKEQRSSYGPSTGPAGSKRVSRCAATPGRYAWTSSPDRSPGPSSCLPRRYWSLWSL
jgi:cobalt/nickel transport system permease protein